jgi:hypothetical protein
MGKKNSSSKNTTRKTTRYISTASQQRRSNRGRFAKNAKVWEYASQSDSSERSSHKKRCFFQ